METSDGGQVTVHLAKVSFSIVLQTLCPDRLILILCFARGVLCDTLRTCVQVDMDAMNDTYFEVIGTPIDGSTIKMVNCCNLGDHLSAFYSLPLSVATTLRSK